MCCPGMWRRACVLHFLLCPHATYQRAPSRCCGCNSRRNTRKALRKSRSLENSLWSPFQVTVFKLINYCMCVILLLCLHFRMNLSSCPILWFQGTCTSGVNIEAHGTNCFAFCPHPVMPHATTAWSWKSCSNCVDKSLGTVWFEAYNSAWFCLFVSVPLGTSPAISQSNENGGPSNDLRRGQRIQRTHWQCQERQTSWRMAGGGSTTYRSVCCIGTLKDIEHGLVSCPTPWKAQCPLQQPGSPICVHMETWAQSFFCSSFTNALRREKNWANSK